jgi:hypothetical protein
MESEEFKKIRARGIFAAQLGFGVLIVVAIVVWLVAPDRLPIVYSLWTGGIVYLVAYLAAPALQRYFTFRRNSAS